MLAGIISKYLEENRRLVVPQLGAFLVKEPDHTLVFSQLIKKDDGILHALLLESGVSEIEASGMIQRLTFDVHFVQQNGGEFLLEGLGRFFLTPDDKLTFEVQETKMSPEAEPMVAETLDAVEDDAAEEEKVSEDLNVEDGDEELHEGNEQEQNTTSPPSCDEESLTATSVPLSSAQSKGSEAAKRRFEPDPDLAGLTYGSRRSRGLSGGSSKASGGFDVWMIVAIASVALAVGVILYGLLRDGAGFSLQDTYTEQGL